MNILIDIGHPAHVHLFRNFYFLMKEKNHRLVVTIKDNLDAAKKLLDLYEIPYIAIGNKSDNLFYKALRQISYDIKIARIVNQYKIDIGIGTSVNLAHASRISKMKSIVLDDDDDEVEPLFTRFGHPFCDELLSPESLAGKRKRKNTIYYAGFHELAYLHPNRFKPDKEILKVADLTEDDIYFVLRFNAFKAHHDLGVEGISLQNKRKLISLLERYGRVFITSEAALEPEFEKYRIKIPPHHIHSFIYFAHMLIGDSQTMTSEAAVMGVPSIRSNSFAGRISYLEEEEHKYGLTFAFKPSAFGRALKKAQELLEDDDLKGKWKKKQQQLLNEKIDVTAYLIWFVENYPESIEIIRKDSKYQYKFK